MNKPFSFSLNTTNTGANTSGSIFGGASSTPAQPAQTGFGSGFGFNKPATTATSSPFGQAAQPSSTTFGGFGQTATTGTTGTSLFGQTATSTAPATSTGFGGFAATQPATATTTQPSTGFGGFGSSLGSTTASTGLFGSQQAKPQTSLFSSTPATGTSTLGASLSNTFNQPSQQNTILLNQTQATLAPTDQDNLLNSLVNPQVFNDERDAILAKWNQLQAFYGFGKMFHQNSSIEVNKENQLSRFKTIGYNCKPTNKNEDGLVCLTINKKDSDVRSNQKAVIDCLHKIFNSDQSLSIVIDSIKPSNDDKTELVFYINQRVSQLTDQTNRVASLLVYNHLNKQEVPANSLLGGLKTNQTIKQQLEQINVVNMYPLVGLTDEQIKNYLDNPPTGLNPVLWDQAKKNNPNPKKLIPVQISGFQEINKRFKLQEQENASHKETLNYMNDSIESLNSRNKLLKSKIDQFKSRNEDLEQRVMKVMINYEIRRKIGIPLQENEKYLLSILDSFQMELNSPINKEIQRQKLNEFVEIIKSYESTNRQQRGSGGQALQTSSTGNVVDSIDASNLGEVQKSLREQHKAFKSLIDIVNKDLKDLDKIKKGLGIEK